MAGRSCYLVAALALAALAGAAHAEAPALPADDWTPVPAVRLDSQRGGFDTGSGLTLSIGIERVVSVNGDIIARSQVTIPDLTQLTATQAQQVHDALGAGRLVQLGANNFSTPQAALGAGAMLIQNSLDNQQIRSQTVISANANSLSLLKDLNFMSTVRDVLARAGQNL